MISREQEETLHKHVGACVILCQQIEQLLTILVRRQSGLNYLEWRQLFEEYARMHTKTLEWLLRKIESESTFKHLLPILSKFIIRRNKIVHRLIISSDIIDWLKGGHYDFDSDLVFFREVYLLLNHELDKCGVTEGLDIPEEICDFIVKGIYEHIKIRKKENEG